MMIPLWYSLCLGAAGAYFGFWFGRSRTWGLIEQSAAEGEGGGRSAERRTRGDLRYRGRSLSSPAGGKLESCGEGEKRSIRILTTEGMLYAPVSGRVLKISPRGNAFLIRADWGTDVTVRACTSEDDLLDRYFRPRVVRGEIVRKGKLLLEYDREKLCRKCEDTAVYVTVEGEKEEQVQVTEKEQVKAGETILWMQRAGLT